MSPTPRLLKGIYLSTFFWSVIFIIITALAANLVLTDSSAFHRDFASQTINSGKKAELGSGGPSETALRDKNLAALLGAFDSTVQINFSSNSGDDLFSEDSALLGRSNPSVADENRAVITKYRVQKGDTVEKLSLKFNISGETIEWANPGIVNDLKPGQSLFILPVSGLLHQVSANDTLKTVANLYNVKSDLIKKYNPSYENIFEKSDGLLIIPFSSPVTLSAVANESKDLRYYLTLPARGWNWGDLHYNNAVDIADGCGNQIYAAQDGVVTEESGTNFWNDGYGNYVVIEHPNRIKTKYAHNRKNLVKVGAYVRQGDPIAEIGSSGKTHGVTGCHLHFEVQGAKNPFAIQ